MCPAGRFPTIWGGARRLPRAFGSRFYDLLGALRGPISVSTPSWSDSGAILARCWTSRTSKIKVFVWRVCIFSKNLKFRKRAPKVRSGAPWPPPKRRPKSTPGRPLIAKSGSKVALGRPRAHPMNCFWPPGRSQERFGALLGPTFGPHGGPERPRELQELIFDPPEALQGPFLTYFSRFLWCNSDALRLLFLSFCLCVCVFARVFF